MTNVVVSGEQLQEAFREVAATVDSTVAVTKSITKSTWTDLELNTCLRAKR